MSARKVHPEAVVSKTFEAPSGAVINLITAAPEPLTESGHALAALANVPLATMHAALEQAGVPHIPAGRKRLYLRAHVREVFDALREGFTPRAAKTAPRKSATTAEIAAANGFKIVTRGGK